MRALLNFVLLPREVTAFEDRYLARVNRVALWFFAGHLPLFLAIATFNNTGPLLATVLWAAVMVGPVVAVLKCGRRMASVVMGVAAMFMGGILVHIGQGPVQIEMHFYFFTLLALLVVFANPMPIVAAAGTAAVHHLLLWLLLPKSVFNYDAPVWVVGVHAAFVVLESVAACYIARSFFDNVIGLEKIVAARTTELNARNQDMRMLLDAVEQGFFTVNRAGVMSEERSAAVGRMLGDLPAGATFPDALRPLNPTAADWMAMGLDDVFADLLPVEVTLGQLPGRLVLGEKTLKVEYAPVPREGAIQAVAVVLTDITAAVARERLEAEHRVLMAMAERIGQDKAGFLEFFQEAEELVTALAGRASTDLTLIKRKVHTLKGNAAIFGLDPVAEVCHQIEDHIAENATLPDEPLWEELNARWTLCRENLKKLIGEATVGITLEDADYAGILAEVLNHAPRDVIAHRLAAWRLEPTGKRMARLVEQARRLALRVGKGEVNVHARGGELRLDPERWSFFWSAFVHVIRNAVDHGLESVEERAAAGKDGLPTIELTTSIRKDRFVVSVSDNGRGVNWSKVAEVAAARGLPTAMREDLVNALFCDGLSTSASVTEVSGRGIGMGAVRSACTDLGGSIAVVSEPGAGTTFEFSFPVSAMAPATVELLAKHGIGNPEWAFFGGNSLAITPLPAGDTLMVAG